MGPSQGMVTIADLKPKTVTHENSMLYAALKQSLTEKYELQQALLDATEMIHKLTNQLEQKNASNP